MKNSKNIDSVYYKDGVNKPLAMQLLLKARINMFNLFMSQIMPTERTRILDIGVSDEENEGANFLEKHYPWQHNITCAGLGNGIALIKAYPKIEFKRIKAGQRLPFDDQSYDVVCSNAVIEHVGGPEQRTAFIAEHLRIGKMVFMTFPNRWFPVEHHSSIPLLHFYPPLFRRILKGTRYSYWTDPSNMDFLDGRAINRAWPAMSRAPTLIIPTGLKLGPFSSNWAVIVK